MHFSTSAESNAPSEFSNGVYLSTAHLSAYPRLRAMYTDGMPPTSPEKPLIDVSHMLPEHTQRKQRGGSGPIVGVVIIVLLLIIGALYFWGALLNDAEPQPLPFIPGDSVTS